MSLRDGASLAYWRARAAASTAVGRTRRRLASTEGRVAILMYHRVLPDAADTSRIEPGMYVRASTFERHVKWIRRRWPIRTLGEALRQPPAAGSRPAVVLTFDDGWRDNLTVAWPILERHGASATIFLVRDWVAAGRNADGEFLRPGEVRDLAAAGVEFGAHSATHPHLDALEPAAAEQEMRASKHAVEEWTGGECPTFAYPFGAVDAAAAEIARDLFRASVTVVGGWWGPGDDTALLPRIGVHQDMTSTPSLFALRLAEAAA